MKLSKNLCMSCDSKSSKALFMIRVMLAIVFIYHGYSKITNIDATIGYFNTLGFSPFLTYLVAYGEFIGGILMLLGTFTCFVSLFFIATMVVAIFSVHLQNGFDITKGGYEYALTLLVMSLAIFKAGPGAYAKRSCVSSCACQADCKCPSEKK